VGDKIIELGYGRGVLTEKLAEVCKELIVVDGPKENI
jgi:16S rRNA A1518/A1519 N6-dimethyltransferase RsmA/KsgA/DIM1 with predicted DNA glycosylase/AP lyase activity